MDLQYLFNDVSLYTKEIFNVFELKEGKYELNKANMENFVKYVGFGRSKIISYCHKCKKEFPFSVTTKYIDFYDNIQNGVPTMIITKGFSNSPGGRIETINGTIWGAMPPYPEEYLLNNKIWYVEYYFECTNNKSHKYLMVISIEFKDGNFIVRKIGQNPSMLTIKGFDFDKYKKQLEKIDAYDDYKKADLSNADHFYVGAYAYLRRIFEKMVNNYIINKNDIKKHMDEKIDMVKSNFDPRIQKMLSNLYGILSVSIHELDEEESKEYYQYLKAIIDIQLEYQYTESEKDSQTKKLESILNKITNGIKIKKGD